jgi:Phage integrase family/Domain of unknown function (DUF3883)
VIAWRKDLEARALSPASIRRKLSALSALFDYLCERNAVSGNPVDGVKRPLANGNEGSPPALGDAQACKLLEAPPDDTLKGVRDRAILATLLYHGLRREELCGLRVRDIQSRQGVVHFRVKGKRDKIRFVPLHAAAQRLIEEYLALAGHGGEVAGPLFRPVKNNRTKEKLDRPLDPASVYRNIVRKYGLETGISGNPKIRKAIETRAMDEVLKHYKSEGYQVENTSKTKCYDYLCTKGRTRIHVEVKGTRTDGKTIALTFNEVELAKDPNITVDLWVVHSIKVVCNKKGIHATGGLKRPYPSWKPDDHDIRPVHYACRLKP